MKTYIKQIAFTLITIFFLSEKAFAQPTMTLPTSTTITNNSATLGGTIAGAGITARGTAWKTSSPVLATDNQLAEGGTTAGAYTHSRALLPSGTRIFFVAYGTNAGGTAISSESSFYTLSNPPSGQPASLTASAISNSQINLSWPSVTANGFLIYRKAGGTAPDVTVDFVNGTNPPAALTDGSTLVTTAAGGATSFNNTTGLSAGTRYSYTLVPFGYNGSNNETYNFLTAAAPTANAYTFSNPPSGQPASLNSVSISNSQINLTWPTVTANGFLIYRKAGGTAPNVTIDFVNGTAPPATLTDGSALVNTAAGAATSFNNTTGLLAASQYSYTLVPFGYNGANSETYNYLTAGAPATNTFTLSNPASGQPATFTATVVSSSRINLAWGAVTSNGFLIYRRNGGTAPDVSGISNANIPPVTLGDGSILVSTAAGGTTTYPNTGLTGGTQYSYTIVPFGYDGANSSTYNYLIAGAKTSNATTYNATSTITLNGGTTASIDYASYQTVGGPLTTGGGANSVSLAQFRVNDLGGDGTPTTLTSVTIDIGNFSNVSEIAIFDNSGTNVGQQTVIGTSVTFSGLSIVAANSNVEDFRIRATFNSVVLDQQSIDLTVTGATSTGSGFTTFGATTGTSVNKINVMAVQLIFSPTTLTNAAKNVNFGPLTVSAVDLNGNVQKSRSNTVTLDLFNGTGTLNSGAQSLTPNLVNGTFTWPNLSIDQAGNGKTIRARYTGLVTTTININIATAGVTVSPGTVASMCYSGDFQLISTITISESDPSDFSLGNGQSISFLLPTGFIFNTGITTTPTISGNEINSITNLSYSGNNTVQFSYNISGTSNGTLDKIMINGLQVKYTGTSPTTGNLLRFGGSAIQAGNASSDAKNHCTLSAANSLTVVDFGVQELPGDPVVVPTTTQFGSTSKTVRLIGNPAGGVFSGSAVVFASGNYTFSPSTVGVGSYNIAYTYTETIGQHCQVTVQKTFTVVSNFITGLLNEYCSNGTDSPGLTVPQATIDAFLASRFTLTSGYFPYVNNTYDLKEFVFWEPVSRTFTAITGTNNDTFDPKNPQFAYSIGVYGAVWVGARYKNKVTSIVPTPDGQDAYNYIQYAYIRVYQAPVLSFNLPASICVNSASIDLIPLVTPTPATQATDKFTAVSGVTNPSVGVATFNPSNVPGASSSPQTVAITYQFKDQNVNTGGCTNTIIKSITVNPVPLAPTLASTNSPVDVCQGNTPTQLTASPAGPTYSWYSNAALGAGNFIQTGDNFTPTSPNPYFNNTIVNDYQFFLTQTVAGCESPSRTVTVSVKAAPRVGFDPGFTITESGTAVCAGNSNNIVDLTSATTGATVGTPATTAAWDTNGTGDFLNASNTILTAPFTLNQAVKYRPDSVDQTAGGVILKLTTDTPTPPCAAAVAKYSVVINKVPSKVVFTNPAATLVINNVVEYCDNLIDNKLVAAGAGTGNITYYSNPALTNILFNGQDSPGLGTTYFYNFNPAVSRDVDFYVTQTVNNCQSPAATLKVLLHPVPAPAFTMANFCFDEVIPQAATQFTDQTPPLSSAGSGPSAPYSPFTYKWDFGDNSGSTLQNPSHSYPRTTIWTSKVTVTTNKGCVATSSDKNQEIGPIPQTNFTFTQLCKGDNTQFTYDAGALFNNSSFGTTIDPATGWAWSFGDPTSGSNSSNAPNPTHQFSGAGLFTNSLVLTSKLGCQNIKTKEVYVLPKITFNTTNNFVYSESFENNNNGPNSGAWASEVFLVNANSNLNSSWNLIAPNGGKLNSASDGVNAWVAGLKGVNKTYYQSETSVLNGPCFDISGLQKPVISFDYFVDTWTKNDGVYVQYSIDNGNTWNTYGKKDKGVNWYNNNFIAGLSGSGNIGQAVGQEGFDGDGNIAGWSTGRYSLSGLGSNNIRIRFFMGTGGNIDGAYFPNYHNGFGLDNVNVQNSNRTVLAENFTNNSAPNFATNQTSFKNFKSSASALSLVKLEYHTNFGGTDQVYNFNKADPQARAVFYGVTSSFKGFIDSYSQGQIASGPINNPTWADDYFDQRALVPSPLLIKLNTSSIADEVTIKANIEILTAALPPGSGTSPRYAIQMAIVEDIAGQFIFRKLLPNASGKILTKLNAADTSNVTYKWQSSSPLDPTKLFALCFVQDLTNKEVLQATIMPLPVTPLVTGIETIAEYIQLYPNPANDSFVIELPTKTDTRLQVNLIDQVGRPVQEVYFEVGEQTKTVDTHQLAGGIYVVQIGAGKSGVVRKKMMIVHTH